MSNRAQSTVIGAVLMFGILTVSFSVYHASVVPNEFKQTEFEHNQEVQGDMLELADQIRDTAATGIDSSQTVSFGGQYQVWTAYPSPPLYGSIETPNGTVTVSGLRVTGNAESNDYWADGDQTYSTHSIRYQPSYREYQNPPETVIEHGNVFNDFGDETIGLGSQDIVTDDSVNLILIGGDINETRGKSGRITVNSVSSSSSYTQVEGSFTLTLPTDRSQSYWDSVADEDFASATVSDGKVEISLSSPNPLSFRVTRVSVESESNSAEYITIEDSDVVVRDKYGNPVGGVEINVDETGKVYYSNEDGTVDIPDPSSTIHPYIYSNSTDQEFVTVASGDLSEGDGSGSDSATVFNSLSYTTNGGGNKYTVSFDVEDPDGIDRIEFSLRDAADNELDSGTESGYGTSAQGDSGELNESPDTADYIRVTVIDGNGNEKSQDIDV